MEKLHPKAIWLFFFHLFFGSLIPNIFFVFWIVIFTSGVGVLGNENRYVAGPLIAGLYFVLNVVSYYVIAKLTYKYWRYELEEDAFRKESGIIWKKYVSIPYERIQNVDITRGILARILGFSTLNVQTAGYSGGYQRGGMGTGMSEGHIPAVSKEAAEKIRVWVMHRITGKKSGL